MGGAFGQRWVDCLEYGEKFLSAGPVCEFRFFLQSHKLSDPDTEAITIECVFIVSTTKCVFE